MKMGMGMNEWSPGEDSQRKEAIQAENVKAELESAGALSHGFHMWWG